MVSSPHITVTAHFSRECDEDFMRKVEQASRQILPAIPLPDPDTAKDHSRCISVDYTVGAYINDGVESDGTQECILTIGHLVDSNGNQYIYPSRLAQIFAKALHSAFSPEIRIPIMIFGSEVVFFANRDDEAFDRYPALSEPVAEAVRHTRTAFSLNAKA